jgi:type IV pilus assembly protein PilP
MIKHMKTISLSFYVFAAILTTSGCDKKPEVPANEVSQNNQSPVAQQTVLADATPANVVAVKEPQTDFLLKKDPFKPFIIEATRSLPPKKNRFGLVLPILNYEVNQFQVKGIITGFKENSALILDPTGKPYVVKTGMEIGRNDGKITKITNNYIEVFEQYRDESGKLNKNIIKLTLPKKE